jgi:hypothetical protein
LDSAKKYAGNVCKNSSLVLFPTYYDLFKVQNNDNPESLFALQWAGGVGYGSGNANATLFFAKQHHSSSTTRWMEGFQPTYDLYRMYSANDTVRRKATIMLNGDLYPELNQAGGGYKATGTGLKKHIIGNEKDNNAPTMDILVIP